MHQHASRIVCAAASACVRVTRPVVSFATSASGKARGRENYVALHYRGVVWREVPIATAAVKRSKPRLKTFSPSTPWNRS